MVGMASHRHDQNLVPDRVDLAISTQLQFCHRKTEAEASIIVSVLHRSKHRLIIGNLICSKCFPKVVKVAEPMCGM